MPKFSTNKKTVTIKLRTGIKFNDGTTFDAAAVKQSLDRHKTLPARRARASSRRSRRSTRRGTTPSSST
jgi:peptide/nickel transport system substrate-binding protein